MALHFGSRTVQRAMLFSMPHPLVSTPCHHPEPPTRRGTTHNTPLHVAIHIVIQHDERRRRGHLLPKLPNATTTHDTPVESNRVVSTFRNPFPTRTKSRKQSRYLRDAGIASIACSPGISDTNHETAAKDQPRVVSFNTLTTAVTKQGVRLANWDASVYCTFPYKFRV
ncbi:hypothetical protein OG21DRAFT_1495345 [Imleria badia]|nr:hypothetical protein OG21DRAFT_1495345 [Imleria badia]